jgi:hypothetical protein
MMITESTTSDRKLESIFHIYQSISRIHRPAFYHPSTTSFTSIHSLILDSITSGPKSTATFSGTLLLLIFCYLDVKQKVRLANTCLRFRLFIGREEAFWQRQYAAQFKAYNSREHRLEEYFKKKLDYLYSSSSDMSKSRLPLDGMRRFCVRMQWLNNWECGRYTVHELPIPFPKLSNDPKSKNEIKRILLYQNYGIIAVDVNNNIYFASYYANPMAFHKVENPWELQLTDVNDSQESESFADLKKCYYRFSWSRPAITFNADYLAILAFPSASARYASFVVFWKLEKGELKQARWTRLVNNICEIDLIHENWLIIFESSNPTGINVVNYCEARKPIKNACIYNLQDQWKVVINTELNYYAHLILGANSNNISILSAESMTRNDCLLLKNKELNTRASFTKYMKWHLDPNWRHTCMEHCKLERYSPNEYILYGTVRSGKMSIISQSQMSTRTITYTGYVKYISSRDAKAYIENGNEWYMIDLNNGVTTNIGSINISLFYIGMAAEKYIVVVHRDLGFIVIVEDSGKITERYRIPNSGAENYVDDVAIVFTKSDGIVLMDFSGLIQS